MSRKIRIIELQAEERLALRAGHHSGKSPAYRNRCHMILLKSEGRSSKDIAAITHTIEPAVNNWLNRYESAGISGLQTKAGRGRKPILDEATDLAAVSVAVKAERQRLSQAKEILHQELNKHFSLQTLKRFLKNISAPTNVSAAG